MPSTRSSTKRSNGNSEQPPSKESVSLKRKFNDPEVATAAKRPRKTRAPPKVSEPQVPFPGSEQLREAVRKHEYAVEKKAKDRAQKKGDHSNFLDLQRWIDDLYSLLNTDDERDKKYFLTSDELLKVLEWKLARERSRPFLPKLVKSNEEEFVQDITRAAFSTGKKATDLSTAFVALNEVCKLKGIGPATGSALMTLVQSNLLPFFSDEAAMYFLSEKELGSYSMKAYKQYAQAVQDKVEQLNGESEETKEQWDARKLERALWSFTILNNELN